jgi:hypothetical protein
MADYGHLSGIDALSERHGRPAWRRDGAQAQAVRKDGEAPHDSVEVARGADVVVALVRQQVLLATVARLPHPVDPASLAPRAVPSPSRWGQSSPPVAISRIRAEQRHLAASSPLSERALDVAFLQGLDRAEAILDEVHQRDAEAAAWIDAARRMLSA